jgi:hypothetical protein
MLSLHPHSAKLPATEERLVSPSETASQRGGKKENVQSDTLLGQLSLFYPVLVSCTLERTATPEEAERDKIERFYESTISSVKESYPPYVAFCEFSAGQKFKDTKILEIQATYFLAFRCDDRTISETDKRHVLKELAQSAAWPLFRNLFIHVGTQSGEELPMLPNHANLEWRDSEEKTP